jgi:methyl-accepting chemotaxis protein
MTFKSWFGFNGSHAAKLPTMALMHSSAAVMIVDPGLSIVYVNTALRQLFELVQADLQQEIPQFSLAALIGSSVQMFHKNAAQLPNIVARLATTHREEIVIGGRVFQLLFNPLIDEQQRRQGTSITWQDISDIKKQNILNAQLLTALEATSTNVMVADAQRTIIYMNKAVEKMLMAVEADLRTALPHFSVDSIIGSSMDIFHHNPAHQKRLLAELKNTYTGNIEVAGRSFRLIANPIMTDKGERIGSVVEWQDRTKEVAAEQQLSRLLGALNSASANVMITDQQQKIIYLNQTIQHTFERLESELRQVLPQFLAANIIGQQLALFFSQHLHLLSALEGMQSTYTTNLQLGKLHFRLVANPIFSPQGERIGAVLEWLDRTGEVTVENEINQVITAAATGDFSCRIQLQHKTDFFLNLAQGLNRVLASTENGLNDINAVLGAIASGDLTQRVVTDYQGSFAALKDGCNQTTATLLQMLAEIRVAVTSINTASSEITQGNIDLSSRTEQQASSLEETAASMEELTGTVRQNADNARQANTLAAKASDVAVEGGTLIEQVVQTMASINESAQKIADIIGVIDGIAFQTNILALNAAVEAARAGEQGRGFAVVAAEVRTLAQRSANAAKDIKALISDSVNKIKNGNELVGKSGNTMKDIVISIQRVNDIMAEIAAASAEQSAGLDEVSKAVTQMDEMTQQNAALVEQAAAAAESLLSQSAQLADSVGRFTLDDGGTTLATTSVVQPKSQPRAPVAKVVTKPVARPEARPQSQAASQPLKPAASDEDEWESF